MVKENESDDCAIMMLETVAQVQEHTDPAVNFIPSGQCNSRTLLVHGCYSQVNLISHGMCNLGQPLIGGFIVCSGAEKHHVMQKQCPL
jgi:hypothetical protein